MKKLISILLVMTIILSCLALVGCEWFGGEQTTATTTTTTTTTTAPPPVDPSTIEFKHDDNFTEKDIEFIKSFHGYQDMIVDPIIFSFTEMIDTVRKGKWHLYYAHVDIDNPVYICGYIDISTEENLYEWTSNCIDVTKYVWYKFDADEEVPEKIDNMSLGWGFHIYDAVIAKDIGNGTNPEHKFKYYSLTFGGVRDVIEVYEYMLIHYYKPLDEIVGIEEIRKCSRCYQGYTSTNGKDYFVLKVGNSLEEDGTISDYLDQNKNQLGDCYDILSPYFERIEEMDDIFTDIEGVTVKRLRYGISLDIIKNILIDSEN